MKTLFFILFSFFSVNTLFSSSDPFTNSGKPSTKFVCGKVIDKNTGEEIAGAEIKIGDEKIYSDFDGNFFAVVKTNKIEALVKFVSYNDTKIALDVFSYSPLIIEME